MTRILSLFSFDKKRMMEEAKNKQKALTNKLPQIKKRILVQDLPLRIVDRCHSNT